MAYTLRQEYEYRTLDRIARIAAAGACACSLATSIANAQQVRARFPLTPSQIVGEMQSRQLPTRGVQVRLAVPMTSAIANPPLEIQAVAQLNPHEMRLRMSCRDRSECLSFFATATYPEELTPASLPIKAARQSSRNAQPVSAARPLAEAPPASSRDKQAGSVEPPIVRSGSPATLDFDEDRVHIRLEVICLEGGAAGDKIRVTSRDRKQIYVARIVTPTLLKGNF